MNPDYTVDPRRAEPLPGAWRNKSSGSDYYGANDPSAGYRDPRYDYVGVYDNKHESEQLLDRSVGSSGYDRFNGNQPIFPPLEDRQMLAGGEGQSRKRPMRDVASSSMYQSKRSHESRPSAPNNYRFQGDSLEILQEESRKCIAEMSQELAVMESSQSTEFGYLAHARRLLNEEVNKITENMNPDWLDVESSKTSVKVLKRVLLPRTRPGSNVVGRLMGVGGSTLRKMCQTYKCHISICGTGSRKNPKEEQELLRSGETRYNHLACPLHAEVSTTGPPHLAYSRLGQILTLLHKIITIEERFEHDGLVFETSNTKRRREDGEEEDGNDQPYEEREPREQRTSNYRGRGSRGRGFYNNRSGSPSRQPRTTSWRNTGSADDNNEETSENRSSQTSAPSRGGRGRGGFVPRGSSRGGFVPRARTEQ